jgi:ABC-type Fe3+ transport system permease subunit
VEEGTRATRIRGIVVKPDREPATNTPRWVKVFGAITIIALLLFVILHLTGHGFGGHMPHQGGH